MGEAWMVDGYSNDMNAMRLLREYGRKQKCAMFCPYSTGKLEKFSRAVAIKGCEVNDEKYDPALWWSMYGGSTPNLKKIAMRILSLTTSSSECERNWSTFEGVHTKKRNRLDATRMSNLVYVQFNANLMEKNKRRKARDHEVLLAQEAGEAQEWIVEGEVCEDGVEGGLPRETASDDMGTRTSARCESFMKKSSSPRERLKVARDRQKSYADKRRKPLEFSVGDKVLLKVSSRKGVVRFGKRSKLSPRYVGPFEIFERVGPVAYRLRLPQELVGVHDTSHVSNLKKRLADVNLHVPLDEFKVDDNYILLKNL
nr:reverse transcriptase domain-containing protein [Tanacetum cinerariifolium]